MKRAGFVILVFLVSFFALLCSGELAAQSSFMMGEDVIHPAGLVLTVNEILRKPFAGGLGGKGKQDEIRINLTIVNTGLKTFQVDPQKDFSLELSKTFSQAQDNENRATKRSFSVFPSTQSRVDLYFRVPAEDKVMPVLFFSIEDSRVRVFCSPELEKLAQKSAARTLSLDEARTLSQFYVDAGRYSEAKGLLEGALQVAPGDNQLLMLMAAVHQGYYDQQAAAECLERINPAQINTFKDAVALARMAIELGHYKLAVAVLEPYEAINRLDDENLILLARAFYYQDDLSRAERILQQLRRKGVEDRLIYFTLGNIKDRQDSLDEAIALWEKAIEVDPDYCEAYFNIGVGYYKQEKMSQARHYWQKVLHLRPDSHILRATEDALAAIDY